MEEAWRVFQIECEMLEDDSKGAHFHFLSTVLIDVSFCFSPDHLLKYSQPCCLSHPHVSGDSISRTVARPLAENGVPIIYQSSHYADFIMVHPEIFTSYVVAYMFLTPSFHPFYSLLIRSKSLGFRKHSTSFANRDVSRQLPRPPFMSLASANPVPITDDPSPFIIVLSLSFPQGKSTSHSMPSLRLRRSLLPPSHSGGRLRQQIIT